MNSPPFKPIEKKAKKGFKGFPVATVALYGPDNRRASKVAVAIVPSDGAQPSELRRWQSYNCDIRTNAAVNKEITQFIRTHGARSVVITEGIIGCPHEEGIDYPDGQDCPACPFWIGRNRFTGKLEH